MFFSCQFRTVQVAVEVRVLAIVVAVAVAVEVGGVDFVAVDVATVLVA